MTLALAVVAMQASQLGLRPLTPLDATGLVTYVIEDGEKGSGFQPGDRELARWALDAWARATGGRLRFAEAPRASALVRIHWVPAAASQFGEMQPIEVNGRRGAAVYIRPDTSALGPELARMAREDPLVRETIVYLTCLHELGHALGLSHTDDYADIMYFFGYGGDIPEYFMRYRRQLKTRSDIAKVAGLSPADVAAVRAAYSR